MSNIRNWIIYKHISPSDGIYIGITCQKLNNRWRNGSGYKECPFFYKAIQKYGWDNIRHEILYSNLTEQEAKKLEKELIIQYKQGGKCYNLTYGGDGGSLSNESKQKISVANKNPSEETREKCRKARLGTHHSEEVKKFLSEHNKNRPKEWHIKISKAHSKPIQQFDLDGNFIKEFESALIAKQETGIDNSAIALVCRGKRHKAGGFKWKFKYETDI